jgi:hypothetical protein
MTRPASAQERRSLLSTMKSARGERNSKSEVTAPVDKEDENVSDLDDIIRRDCKVSEEDMFLPQQIPPFLAALPDLLREHNADVSSYNWTADQLFDKRRHAVSDWFKMCLSLMFDRNLQTNRDSGRTISRELLSLNDRLEATASTEFLPTLRRIAMLERSRDAEHHQQQISDPRAANIRSSRLQARSARKHYFDTISKKLAWDEGPLSTGDLAQSLAQNLLTYIDTV